MLPDPGQGLIPSGALLELIDPRSGKVLQKWEFEGTHRSISIGRSERSDVRITSKLVSRHHATLTHDSGNWYLEVFGANGCYVNGCFVDGEYLQNGSILAIGQSGPTIRFSSVTHTQPQTSLPPIESFRQHLLENSAALFLPVPVGVCSGQPDPLADPQTASLEEIFCDARETWYGDDD